MLACSAALAACAPPSPTTPSAEAGTLSNASQVPSPAPAATPASAPATPSITASPDAPTASLPEPTSRDPDSAQAAATVVETYFAQLDAGRTKAADALWGDAGQAAAFRHDFAALGDYHAEVDAPGEPEGAAGSIYVTVPVRFIPAASVPNPRPRMGQVVLRRVNDVPGSTEAQRRWHIERIDVAMTPK